MIDLAATYEQLARPCTHEQLAEYYRNANSRRELMPARDDETAITTPIALLASSIPQSTSLSVAVHMLHILPPSTGAELAEQLLRTIDENAAAVLHSWHRALERDGRAHHYTADEWQPIVYDTAGGLLEGSRLDHEPPSAVENAQMAVRWLAGGIIDLDRDAADTPAALADGLAHLLTLCVFADVASAQTRAHRAKRE
jgi:hypothetical protein